MPVIEGTIAVQSPGELAGVGAQIASPLHAYRCPIALNHLYSAQKGGMYKIGAISGAINPGIGADSELFQFRYVPTTNRIAVIHSIKISAGSSTASSGGNLTFLAVFFVRQWTVAGSGGTRINLTGNNCKLRTAFPTSEVNDAGITSGAALTIGTRVVGDGSEISTLALGFGTALVTSSVVRPMFDANLFREIQAPIILGSQEGFIIQTGQIFTPSLPWHLGVEVTWSELPNF